MFTLHASARLLTFIDPPVEAPRPATTRLGNWYGNLLPSPHKAMVFVSERTYLPVVLPVSVADSLPGALSDAVAALLRTLGAPAPLIEQERFAMAQVSWAKCTDRSLIGVLTEQCHAAEDLLARHPTLRFPELTRRLADNIVRLQFPVDLTREAFGLPVRTAEAFREEQARVDTSVDDAVTPGLLDAFARLSASGPVDAFVLGQPVEVTSLQKEGNAHRGLVAHYRHEGAEHSIGFADVHFPAASPAAPLSNRWRQHLGLNPHPRDEQPRRRHKAGELDVSRPVELVVLSVKERALRCRLLDNGREITVRTPIRDEVPGEIITVRPSKQWSYAGHRYLSGAVLDSRLDVAALGLTPLALRPQDSMWDPAEEAWDEDVSQLPEWARALLARGPRPEFELEQVLPGVSPDDWDTDPIVEAVELKNAGRWHEAFERLNGLLAQDLRCVDAHAHLGNLEFDRAPAKALRHYSVGAHIAELSLPEGFDGVLPWGLVDNRPYVRCLSGLGLSLWRLGRVPEATAVFRRLLWLEPGDAVGARFNLSAIEAGLTWEAANDTDGG